MTKTFFLGLGGQKCGSTWMQAYLARQPGSDFGRLEEYQAWESDLGSVFARYRVPTPGRAYRLAGAVKWRLGVRPSRTYLRWRMQTDRDAYFEYFSSLLGKPGIRRTGDITPSYAALPAATLARIRDGFAARGIETRALFAMRDPVARLRSHLLMDQQKGYRDRTGDEATDMDRFYASAEAEARMRYDLTLAELEAVFPAEQRFYCLFEDMFTPAGIARFAGFSGVATEPDAGAAPMNARGSGRTAFPSDLECRIARHYAPVYEAVASRLPQIARLWPSARWVITTG
ncbi:sulfotransferase family protein [Rhodobacterales bacterium HKCCSP123]|nr:sulfotransferase family protein [Rhodobacterales bacterium HKCCSP123]